ncbi:MAG: hypothetical protein ACR2PL_04785 [Dehalococcoidia bacterium]
MTQMNRIQKNEHQYQEIERVRQLEEETRQRSERENGRQSAFYDTRKRIVEGMSAVVVSLLTAVKDSDSYAPEVMVRSSYAQPWGSVDRKDSESRGPGWAIGYTARQAYKDRTARPASTDYIYVAVYTYFGDETLQRMKVRAVKARLPDTKAQKLCNALKEQFHVPVSFELEDGDYL